MVHFSPIWINKKQTFSELNGDINADVVIVGGGIIGVSSAYHLLRKNKNVVLLEKNFIASGMSGRGAGILEPGFEMDFVDMIKIYGPKISNNFWKITMKAMNEIKSLIKLYKIDCDLHKTGSIVFALSKNDVDVLKQEVKLRLKNHHPCEFFEGNKINKFVKANTLSIMYSPLEAIFNQEKFLLGLAKYCSKNIKIYEKSPALSIAKHDSYYTIKTPKGSIKTKKIILAAAIYDLNFIKPKHKLHNSTCFEIATKPLMKKQLDLLNWKKGHCLWPLGRSYDYIRLTKDNRLIIGGEDSKISLDSKRSKKHFLRLKKFMFNIFPQLKSVKIDYEWSGVITYTKKEFPEIGKKGNIFYAFTCSGHGLLTGFYAGKILAHLALGKLDKEMKFLINEK